MAVEAYHPAWRKIGGPVIAPSNRLADQQISDQAQKENQGNQGYPSYPAEHSD